MADEIQLTVGLSVTKGELTESDEPGVQEIDMAGERYSAGVQDIGFAAHEQISLGSDFGTAGWGWFVNLDATNFVELGRDSGGTFVPFAKLMPGVKVPIPLSSKLVYAKADTASVKLKFKIYEA